MAKSRFSLEPVINAGKNQTLTGFSAPKTAATSYQTSAPEMIQRQTAFSNLGKSLGNLTANILQTPGGKASSGGSSQGSPNDLFVGGQGTAVGSQIPTKTTTTSSTPASSTPSEPIIFEPTNTAGASAGASAGSSGGGSAGAAGGGTNLGGTSTMGGPLNNEQKSGLDSDLQKLASLNPELADSIMNKLGYGTKALSAGKGEGTNLPKPTSKFQQGFTQANAVIGPTAGNVSGTQAAGLVNQYAPVGTGKDIPSAYVQTDPFINGLFKTWQDYINPVNQRKSLTDTYNQMLKDSGVQAIDTELLNMKNVIEGSEDDLRNEITKAGGFATESQIMGLTNARNKQLIKNYNTLLDTRNSKEKYLQTAIGLERDDRNSADQKFESMFSMGTQLATLNNQMQNNAKSQMQWLATNVGFDGLFDSTKGDPYYTSLVEKSLGLPQGGLATAAQNARLTRTQKIEKEGLETDLAREKILTERAQRAKTIADTAEIVKKNQGTILDPSTPEGRKQLALNKGQVDQINNVLNSGNMKTAVGPNVFSRFGGIRNIFKPGAANFIGDVEQLASQLNLQSLIDAKAKGATFGALSDQELQVLSNSATKIGAWRVKDKSGNITGYKVKESDFKKELDKINNFAKLDYVYRGGNAEDVGVQTIDGKYYTKNSDGSITEL